ncbi:hypothetical protein MIMGU_mgv11b023300mg [Erythranthe guttata]|uniref:Uncharacterized protein n=1 Tax=Erythranthe guttata TaxID=4155 RepID=A0A022QQ92_ERYGU|nr:hypothetical protein MIMGU_mgv11b023300mg [Erythranthe guttata]
MIAPCWYDRTRKSMHANGLYADKLAPSKLQTLITFDSGGVTTQSAYAREARSDAVVVSIGRSPIDPTLEVKIVRLARCRAVSDANGTFIGESERFRSTYRPKFLRAIRTCARLCETDASSMGKELEEEKKKKKTERRVKYQKDVGWGCNTRTSQGVTHPSTTLAQARLTSEF